MKTFSQEDKIAAEATRGALLSCVITQGKKCYLNSPSRYFRVIQSSNAVMLYVGHFYFFSSLPLCVCVPEVQISQRTAHAIKYFYQSTKAA